MTQQEINKRLWNLNHRDFQTMDFDEDYVRQVESTITEQAKKSHTHRFLEPFHWTGALGEEAVEYYHDGGLYRVSEEDKATDYDFHSRFSHHKIDVKVNASKWAYKPSYYCVVNADQLEQKPYDYIIFCYYDSINRRITIVGWQDKHFLLEHGTHYKKGDDVLNAWGKKRFTAHTNLWDFPGYLFDEILYQDLQ